MGDFLSHLSLGFSVAFTLQNVGLALVGCLVGTLIGVLPGVGPIATITMLLPITFGMPPPRRRLTPRIDARRIKRATRLRLIGKPWSSSSARTRGIP